MLGTSEQTELALSYLRSQCIACAGLIDTNGGSDLGRWVWGTPVIGGLDDLARLANQHGVSEIVLPGNECLPCPDTEFRACCERASLRLFRLGLYPPEPSTENFAKKTHPVNHIQDVSRSREAQFIRDRVINMK